MVKIRLKRMGAKKAPFYRIVVADSRSPRDGKVIEELGTYNPLKNPAEINIKEEATVTSKWIMFSSVVSNSRTDTASLSFTIIVTIVFVNNIKSIIIYLVFGYGIFP